MLRMLQIINFMLVTLEYSEDEVIEIFKKLEEKSLSQSDLNIIFGLEEPPKVMSERFNECLPKWRSALSVTKMRLEA